MYANRWGKWNDGLGGSSRPCLSDRDMQELGRDVRAAEKES